MGGDVTGLTRAYGSAAPPDDISLEIRSARTGPPSRCWRSFRGCARFCSPLSKVSQIERTGDDDSHDEKYLQWNHEPAPMTAQLDDEKNQYPDRKGCA